MRHFVVLLACIVPLGGCNKSPEVHEKNASVAEVAKAVSQSGVANDLFLRAGEWRVSSTMEEMSIPGLPPEAQAQMKQMMGQHGTTTYTYCLTPAEAKRPGGKFFSGKAQNDCRYEHFTMGGGKIDAAMQCQGQSPGMMRMNISGTYSADTYVTNVAMNMEGGHQGSMSMKMRSEAHHIGECTPADEAKSEQESGTKS